jgi:hypothetical protein
MEAIIYTLIGIALIGAVCYVLIAFVPMPEPFPKFVIAAGVILTLLLVLSRTGLIHLG